MTGLRRHVRARIAERHPDDRGMLTIAEILIATSLMIVLSAIVLTVLTSFTGIGNQIYAQYQEYNQALPSLTIVKQLLRAEIEPYPEVYTTNTVYYVPTPGFGLDATPGKSGTTNISGIGNYGLTFYSDVLSGATDVPAMIVAQLYSAAGTPVVDATAGATTCSTSSPCNFQVREYLPNAGSCPVNATSPQVYSSTTKVCTYPTTYELVTNVQDVVNGPYTTSGLDISPIFKYVVYDPTNSYSIPLTPTAVRTGAIAFSATTSPTQPAYIAAGVAGTTLTQCEPTSATNAATQSIAVMCPADAIQRVSVDLQIQTKSSGTNGVTEVETTVYRNLGGNASTVGYPFQFSGSVG